MTDLMLWKNDLLVFDGNDRILFSTTAATHTIVPALNSTWSWKDAPVVSYKKNGGTLPPFPTFMPEGFPEPFTGELRPETQPDSWVEDIR